MHTSLNIECACIVHVYQYTVNGWWVNWYHTVVKGKEGVGAVEKARAGEIGSSPKEPGDGDVATEGGGEGGLKSLLTLWREKVFALLVQARLTQMQHGQELINTRARVSHSCRPFSGSCMH